MKSHVFRWQSFEFVHRLAVQVPAIHRLGASHSSAACRIGHVPHATFPVVPLVVKPVKQDVQEEALNTGRASAANVSAGQAKLAVPFQ
jgi:hypothetical protein